MSVLGQVSRDGEALAVRVPSDGSLRSLKTLIDRLDDRAIEVDELSVHTPDLDDVFLALTGTPPGESEYPMTFTPSPARRRRTCVSTRCATRRRCCAATSSACCATRR